MDKTDVISFLEQYRAECKKYTDCYDCPLCIGYRSGECYLKVAFRALEPYIPIDWEFEGSLYWTEEFINIIKTIYELMPSIQYISRPDSGLTLKFLDIHQNPVMTITSTIDNLTERIPPYTLYTMGEIFTNE